MAHLTQLRFFFEKTINIFLELQLQPSAILNYPILNRMPKKCLDAEQGRKNGQTLFHWTLLTMARGPINNFVPDRQACYIPWLQPSLNEVLLKIIIKWKQQTYKTYTKMVTHTHISSFKKQLVPFLKWLSFLKC